VKTYMAVTATQIRSVERTGKERLALPLRSQRSPEFLFNRELSLIEFFRRVLDEGLDKSQPILERLKFLSIFSSNLDEFFMIRVSGLKDELGYELAVSPDGMMPEEQLREIRARLSEMIDVQMRCLREEILPELEGKGITIVPFNSLANEELQNLRTYFKNKVYPVLTPQAVDPSHPFPYISGQSLNIGLMVKPKVKRRVARALYKTDEPLFVRIKIPPFVSRLIPIENSSARFVLIEELIAANIVELIPEAKPESGFSYKRKVENKAVKM